VPVTDADIAERDSFAGDHGDRRPDIVAVREPGFDSTVVVSLDDGDLEIGCKGLEQHLEFAAFGPARITD